MIKYKIHISHTIITIHNNVVLIAQLQKFSIITQPLRTPINTVLNQTRTLIFESVQFSHNLVCYRAIVTL